MKAKTSSARRRARTIPISYEKGISIGKVPSQILHSWTEKQSSMDEIHQENPFTNSSLSTRLDQMEFTIGSDLIIVDERTHEEWRGNVVKRAPAHHNHMGGKAISPLNPHHGNANGTGENRSRHGRAEADLKLMVARQRGVYQMQDASTSPRVALTQPPMNHHRRRVSFTELAATRILPRSRSRSRSRTGASQSLLMKSQLRYINRYSSPGMHPLSRLPNHNTSPTLQLHASPYMRSRSQSRSRSRAILQESIDRERSPSPSTSLLSNRSNGRSNGHIGHPSNLDGTELTPTQSQHRRTVSIGSIPAASPWMANLLDPWGWGHRQQAHGLEAETPPPPSWTPTTHPLPLHGEQDESWRRDASPIFRHLKHHHRSDLSLSHIIPPLKTDLSASFFADLDPEFDSPTTDIYHRGSQGSGVMIPEGELDSSLMSRSTSEALFDESVPLPPLEGSPYHHSSPASYMRHSPISESHLRSSSSRNNSRQRSFSQYRKKLFSNFEDDSVTAMSSSVRDTEPAVLELRAQETRIHDHLGSPTFRGVNQENNSHHDHSNYKQHHSSTNEDPLVMEHSEKDLLEQEILHDDPRLSEKQSTIDHGDADLTSNKRKRNTLSLDDFSPIVNTSALRPGRFASSDVSHMSKFYSLGFDTRVSPTQAMERSLTMPLPGERTTPSTTDMARSASGLGIVGFDREAQNFWTQ